MLLKGFKPLANSPTAPQYGGDFLGIGNWVRGAANTVWNKALKPAAQYVKDNRLLSKAVGLIPHPAGKIGSEVLRQAGFGRKKKLNYAGKRVLKF